jgi:hypothetical protein
MITLTLKANHRRRLVDLMETIRVNHREVQYHLLELYIVEKERYKERWNEEFKYEINSPKSDDFVVRLDGWK